MKKIIIFLLALMSLAMIIAASVVVYIENSQLEKNKELLNNRSEAKDSETAVIYFSRSGNTEIMAKKIAEVFNGALFTLEASKYKIGFIGLTQAARSYQNRDVEITPKKIDLSSYKRVFLGSPIWFYRPSPPIFEFAKKNRFDGIDVVLFNSYNSNYGDNHIEEFKTIVMKNGAKSFSHIAVKRGRMGAQISTEDFLNQIETLANNFKGEYDGTKKD